MEINDRLVDYESLLFQMNKLTKPILKLLKRDDKIRIGAELHDMCYKLAYINQYKEIPPFLKHIPDKKEFLNHESPICYPAS